MAGPCFFCGFFSWLPSSAWGQSKRRIWHGRTRRHLPWLRAHRLGRIYVPTSRKASTARAKNLRRGRYEKTVHVAARSSRWLRERKRPNKRLPASTPMRKHLERLRWRLVLGGQNSRYTGRSARMNRWRIRRPKKVKKREPLLTEKQVEMLAVLAILLVGETVKGKTARAILVFIITFIGCLLAGEAGPNMLLTLLLPEH